MDFFERNIKVKSIIKKTKTVPEKIFRENIRLNLKKVIKLPENFFRDIICMYSNDCL